MGFKDEESSYRTETVNGIDYIDIDNDDFTGKSLPDKELEIEVDVVSTGEAHS